VWLYPFGVKRLKRKLGYIDLINDGSGDKEQGNYIVKAKDIEKGLFTTVEVPGFHRKAGFWKLLEMALKYLHF